MLTLSIQQHSKNEIIVFFLIKILESTKINGIKKMKEENENNKKKKNTRKLLCEKWFGKKNLTKQKGRRIMNSVVAIYLRF